MRLQLRNNLEALGSPGDWSHITRQVGFYCYLGLNGKLYYKKITLYKITNSIFIQ